MTGAGFVEADHVALDPPEPKAHLHWVVESGLQPIAERYYDTDNWGSDARLHVEAIYHANQNRLGVRRNPQKLTGPEAKPGTVAHTQQIWNSVEVRPDHAIWIPSPEFVEALRSQGAISSGSMSYEAWEGAKAVASEFVDWAKYGAGFVVGVLEGAYGAVRDLVMGVAELFDMVFSIAKALVTEGLDALRQFGSTLYGVFKNAPELLQQLGSDFAGKWNNPDSYDRGGFHGEVVGYVLMQALILVLTLGTAASIQLGGRFAKVVQVVRALDAAADPLVYASKLRHLAKLTPEATSRLHKALGKAVDAGEIAGEPRQRVDSLVESPTHTGVKQQADGAPHSGQDHSAIDAPRHDAGRGEHASGTDTRVSREREATRLLEHPPQLQQQIDGVTGVEKGPAYEHAQASLRDFYRQMEVEAQAITQVTGTRTDGQYAWTFAHDVQKFSHGLINIRFRVYLDGTQNGVSADELNRLRNDVRRGIDEHYNFQHTIADSSGQRNRLHMEIEFVDTPADTHLHVEVRPGDGRADLSTWYVEGHPTTHAHEVGHGAFGLADEYVDASVPHRATPTSHGVYQDQSLMGNYWTVAPDGTPVPDARTRLHDRHLDEISTHIPNRINSISSGAATAAPHTAWIGQGLNGTEGAQAVHVSEPSLRPDAPEQRRSMR